MPEIDGFETCRRLKLQRPNIPIIFMTGLTDVEDVVKGFEAGGIDYVTKPISPDEVIARIKTHIQTARLALSAQDALDHAANNVFCVSNQWRLSWATPRAHQLIDDFAGNDMSLWTTLAELLKGWLATGSKQNLRVNCFVSTFEIMYERQQGDKHLEQIYKKLGVDNRTSAAAISIRILES
jgi:DNA-binding response OmpR family regulator